MSCTGSELGKPQQGPQQEINLFYLQRKCEVEAHPAALLPVPLRNLRHVSIGFEQPRLSRDLLQQQFMPPAGLEQCLTPGRQDTVGFYTTV